MTLVIDPNTPKGSVQLDAIKWAEDQMNEVMLQFFKSKYRLIKGLKFNFRMRLDLKLNETIKVDLAEMSPETMERFDSAIAEARAQIQFITPRKETIEKGGEQIGTIKK